MHRRKIQLIAGTTYSISLPKDWIRENKLNAKDELVLTENNDRALVISPHSVEKEELKDLALNIDEFVHDIDGILFAVYYLGTENITLYSKKELTKEVKAKIRKALTHMSGSEITYEDKQKIIIKVLLDKSKVDIIQVLYRISLIIELSISNILDKLDIREVRINENEIDRLYHLITKVVSVSLIDSNTLHSSSIKNVSLIPSYFLLSKRLENMADDIKHLAEYLHKNGLEPEGKGILEMGRKELNRSVNHIMQKKATYFRKLNGAETKDIERLLSGMKDRTMRYHLREMLRRIIDLEDEVVNISFYRRLIKEKLL